MQLLFATSIGLVDGGSHTFCNGVGIHDCFAVDVSSGTPNRLCQASLVAKETFLVCIEDGDKRDFRQVEAFPEQVHADQHIMFPQAKFTQDAYAVERIDVAMDVSCLNPIAKQILRHFLSHTFRERDDQHTFLPFDAPLNLFHEVVHLIFCGTNLDEGVEQTRRPDDLFHDNAFALLNFIVRRSCADVYNLVRHLLKLLEFQRSVVLRSRQTEAIIHESRLAGLVSAVHRMQLRHRHMAFVDDHEEVLGEEVEQAIRASSRLASVEVTAVVLDSGTMSQLANHFYIVGNAFVQTLCLKFFPLTLKERNLCTKVLLNLHDCPVLSILRGHEEIGRIYLVAIIELNAYKQLSIKLFDALDFIIPESDSEQEIAVGKGDIHRVAFHSVLPSGQTYIVADIKQLVQATQQLVSVKLLTNVKFEQTLVESRWIAHSIDAGNAANNDDILPSGKQSACSREPHLIDFLVDGQVFLDVRISRRHVGFRLIIVVVADVVLHSVVREELLHLAVELSGKRLVVREDEGRAVDVTDDVGDGERLSAARNAQKRLSLNALSDAIRQLLNGFGLVSRRNIIRYELELIHDAKVHKSEQITKHYG